jgi:hypothetical protein
MVMQEELNNFKRNEV